MTIESLQSYNFKTRIPNYFLLFFHKIYPNFQNDASKLLNDTLL